MTPKLRPDLSHLHKNEWSTPTPAGELVGRWFVAAKVTMGHYMPIKSGDLLSSLKSHDRRDPGLLPADILTTGLRSQILLPKHDTRLNTLSEDRSNGERRKLLYAIGKRHCSAISSLKSTDSGRPRTQGSFGRSLRYKGGRATTDSQKLGEQGGRPNFLQIIYQNLTQSQNVDGPFQGWRAGVSIQERAGQIKILFDSLRMLGSSVDIERSLDIALAFERKQFMSSSSQEVYKESIHDKLSSIRNQRQQYENANTNMPAENLQMAQNAGLPAQYNGRVEKLRQRGTEIGTGAPPTLDALYQIGFGSTKSPTKWQGWSED